MCCKVGFEKICETVFLVDFCFFRTWITTQTTRTWHVSVSHLSTETFHLLHRWHPWTRSKGGLVAEWSRQIPWCWAPIRSCKKIQDVSRPDFKKHSWVVTSHDFKAFVIDVIDSLLENIQEGDGEELKYQGVRMPAIQRFRVIPCSLPCFQLMNLISTVPGYLGKEWLSRDAVEGATQTRPSWN